MLHVLAGVCALVYFVSISLATRQHFRSDSYPAGMYLVSALSVLGLAVYAWHAFTGALVFPVTSILLTLVAQALFLWAVRHSRSGKLTLAFDAKMTPAHIVRTGPWRYMRHPFYASYVIFWMACALATQHLVSVIVFLTLTAIYVYSALREEGALMSGPLRGDYLEYRRQVGFLFPKIPAGG